MFAGNSGKLIVLIAVLLLAGGFVFFVSQPSQPAPITQAAVAIMPLPQEKTKISMGYLPIAYHLTAFVAKEKGFFDEEGLDVEMVKFETVNNAM